MHFLRFSVKSVLSFIKQEKLLAFWIYTGMGFASLMILVCSGDYFFKKTDLQQEQFKKNRFEFVFEKPGEQIPQLINELSGNEAVENLCIDVKLKDDVRIAAWSSPERAYIEETVLSGTCSAGLEKENWCIISQNFQWKKQMMEDEVPLINTSVFLNDIACYCIAVAITDEYDILIGMKSMEQLLQSEKNVSDIVEIRAVYVYNDKSAEIELENLNSSVIGHYHPVQVIQSERQKSYSFFSYVKEKGGLMLLMFFAVINYSIIYNYWIKKRYHTCQVFRICGLSIFAMTGMMFFEQIVHFIIIHCIISIMYIGVYSIAFNEVSANIPVLITQCLYAGGALFGIHMLIFIIMEIKTGNLSIMKM